MDNPKFFARFVILTTLLYPNLSLAMDGEHLGSANKKSSSEKLKKQPSEPKKVIQVRGKNLSFPKELHMKEKNLPA